jgi:HlyD family secretion protein
VDNTDLSLRPGMTAAATIVATERTGVLLVPNTALRFSPTTAGNGAAAAPSSSILSKMMPRMPRSTTPRRATETNGGAPGLRQIWVLKDGQAVAQAVKTGISDGRNTEVTGEGLAEGLAIITDQRNAGAAP